MKKLVDNRHIVIAIIACIVIFGALYRSREEQFGRSGESLSMKELIDSRTTQKCIFTSFSPDVDTRGMVYVSGGVLRGDFESTSRSASGGRVVMSHMIVDHAYSYIWSQEMSGAGMKLARSAQKGALEVREGERDPALFDIDRKLDVYCEPWMKNSSLFTPPNDVTFQDMSTAETPRTAPTAILLGR